MQSFAPYLDTAIKAARAAGDLLRADFHRPTGPRGEKDKAPADTEAEQIIRGILLGVANDFGFLGEETGRVPGASGAPVWVVDPNDGTRDYIKGRRGSAVSIALVWNRIPVLGVVHPFAYPDSRGVLYAAAQGREGVFKEGAPIVPSLPDRLSELDTVLVSGGGDRAAGANLRCTKPARMIAIPSIAHRLARVAAGEASAATSLYSPKSWDFAAGHCLILAAGGSLIDQNGQDPVYDDEANGTASRLFAGSRPVALDLSKREWDLAFRSGRETETPIARVAKGNAVPDADLLDRAHGALLGHLIGSAFGGDREGASASTRAPLSGQLGSSGEIAIAVSRSILDLASDNRSLRRVYTAWTQSSPFVPDRAMESAAAGQPLAESLSALALVRVTPLALWAHAAEPSLLAEKAAADASLTHPAPVASAAAAVLAIALQALLRREDPQKAVEHAHTFARRGGFPREVIEAVVAAQDRWVAPRVSGWPDAQVAVSAVLSIMGRASNFEEAFEEARTLSPEDDAVPSVVAAFAGARFGRSGIPERLRNLVLSSRPLDGIVARPRPAIYWATDAMSIAEALLTAR